MFIDVSSLSFYISFILIFNIFYICDGFNSLFCLNFFNFNLSIKFLKIYDCFPSVNILSFSDLVCNIEYCILWIYILIMFFSSFLSKLWSHNLSFNFILFYFYRKIAKIVDFSYTPHPIFSILTSYMNIILHLPQWKNQYW